MSFSFLYPFLTYIPVPADIYDVPLLHIPAPIHFPNLAGICTSFVALIPAKAAKTILRILIEQKRDYYSQRNNNLLSSITNMLSIQYSFQLHYQSQLPRQTFHNHMVCVRAVLPILMKHHWLV